MNIPYFDNWINIDEGFKADINTDKDNKEKQDEIEVEATEGNDVTYIVKGDDVMKKEKILKTNNDGDTVSINDVTTDVTDIKLKKDVINAVDAINDIKDKERAKEIFRLTGGDDTNVKKEIIKIIDDGRSKLMRRKTTNEQGDTVEISLYKSLDSKLWNTTGEYQYLDITDSSYTFNKDGKKQEINIDVHDIYNITSIKSVGKGEYLLPLLFNDVYKRQVYGIDKYDPNKFSIGDNFIKINGDDTSSIIDDNTLHLELKAPNAVLPFLTSTLDKNKNGYYKKCKGENDENYKNAIATSFLNYAKKQNKNRKNLYFCIFCEDNNKVPIGMLFINVSDIKDEDLTITETFKKLISIDMGKKLTANSSKNKFKYSLICENGEPKIKCILPEHYFNKNIQDIKKNEYFEILSRDNFVNEIYTK